MKLLTALTVIACTTIVSAAYVLGSFLAAYYG